MHSRNKAELESLGWKVVVIWECELSDLESIGNKLRPQIKHGLKKTDKKTIRDGVAQSGCKAVLAP